MFSIQLFPQLQIKSYERKLKLVREKSSLYHCKCKLFPNSTQPELNYLHQLASLISTGGKYPFSKPKTIFQRDIRLKKKRERIIFHLWKLPVIGMKRDDVWIENIYFNIFPGWRKFFPMLFFKYLIHIKHFNHLGNNLKSIVHLF